MIIITKVEKNAFFKINIYLQMKNVYQKFIQNSCYKLFISKFINVNFVKRSADKLSRDWLSQPTNQNSKQIQRFSENVRVSGVECIIKN